WRNTCACVSISPGSTNAPRTSTALPDPGRSGPTAAIFPPATATSWMPSICCAGSMTRPPFSTRSKRCFCGIWSPSLPSLSFEQRLGTGALSLLDGDFGAGARDLALQPGDIFLQFGNPQQRQILELLRLALRQQ